MGWIKISRNITSHWLWQDAERLRWWIDILLMAAWEEKKILVGRQMITLRRGQMVLSKSFLYRRWGRSKAKINPFLKLLVDEQMITLDNKHNYCLVTITNYNKYQNMTSDSTEYSTECATKSATECSAKSSTNKEYKEINKEKNIYGERADLRKIRPYQRPANSIEQIFDVNDLWQHKQPN